MTNSLEDDEARLTEINLRIAEWEQRRDGDAIDRLNRCLSPDLVFRRADRSVVGKEAFMKGLGGPSPFASRESRSGSLTVLGDRAVAVVTVIGKREKGPPGVYRNVRVFFRRDGNWQLEVWFNDDLTSLADL